MDALATRTTLQGIVIYDRVVFTLSYVTFKKDNINKKTIDFSSKEKCEAKCGSGNVEEATSSYTWPLWSDEDQETTGDSDSTGNVI